MTAPGRVMVSGIGAHHFGTTADLGSPGRDVVQPSVARRQLAERRLTRRPVRREVMGGDATLMGAARVAVSADYSDDGAVVLRHWCSPSLGAGHGTGEPPGCRRRALPGR